MVISTKSNLQLTDTILMVRPATFGFNTETAKDNVFQSNNFNNSSEEISAKAIVEFDRLVNKLKDQGITVEVIEDDKDLKNPDAVFPNNWISFHHPNCVVTYPMFAKKRRGERRQSIIETIQQKYEIKSHLKFESFEEENKFLEGTGSMIFDRMNNIAYACKSVRTEETLLKEFCKTMNFEKVLFDAIDKNAVPIYHTNVMMCLAADFVIICLESISEDSQRNYLKQKLEATGKEIIDISLKQMGEFAGNMIQLKNSNSEKFLIMSSRAYQSLTQTQLKYIQAKTNIIHSDLTTIETYGGGSARCMIAEIFLNKK